MSLKLSSSRLSALSEFVASHMGLFFSSDRFSDLERGVVSASKEFRFENPEECLDWLLSSALNKNQIEILASHLTVGETYFFRDKKCFEILETKILPEIIQSRRQSGKRLRIWSAGCCTGEEPYSLAILLHRLIPDIKEWNITLLATDINPKFLQKAQGGIYHSWSFRDNSFAEKERFFEKTKEGHQKVKNFVKEIVTFSYMNLAEDLYPSLLNNTNAMDIIFCRNVLMYFSSDRVRRVAGNFYRSLVEKGWLFVSPSETSQALYPEFSTVNFPDAILYRKDQTKQRVIVEEVQFSSPLSFSPSPEPVFSFDSAVPEEKKTPPVQELQAEKSKAPDTYSYEEAFLLYHQGHYEAAEKHLIQFCKQSTDSKASALLSRVLANQGKLSEALTWCEKVISADKLNPAHCYLFAAILQEQGKTVEAISSLKRALYLEPNFALAHFSMGCTLSREGKINEAKKYFQNVLDILRNSSEDSLLPESEGMTAGRLKEIIRLQWEKAA